MKIDLHKKQRIVIIGAGPTGLGVAHRLYELGVLQSKTQVVILEQAHQAGGLASSYRDHMAFCGTMVVMLSSPIIPTTTGSLTRP